MSGRGLEVSRLHSDGLKTAITRKWMVGVFAAVRLALVFTDSDWTQTSAHSSCHCRAQGSEKLRGGARLLRSRTQSWTLVARTACTQAAFASSSTKELDRCKLYVCCCMM